MRENPSPNSINQMKTYNFELLADYFQLYLQDETAKGDLGEAWTEEACALKLAVVPGIIGVGTARDMTVPLTVEIHESDPGEIPGTWDQINNCSIDITSGKLVVSGCTDYFPTAARIELPPGKYNARIFYGGQNTISSDGLSGDDHYTVALWPG